MLIINNSVHYTPTHINVNTVRVSSLRVASESFFVPLLLCVVLCAQKKAIAATVGINYAQPDQKIWPASEHSAHKPVPTCSIFAVHVTV